MESRLLVAYALLALMLLLCAVGGWFVVTARGRSDRRQRERERLAAEARARARAATTSL